MEEFNNKLIEATERFKEEIKGSNNLDLEELARQTYYTLEDLRTNIINYLTQAH